MYEKFTDRLRKVMQLANQEAQRLNHEYIGTEHILLGLAKEGSGVGCNALKNLGINLQDLASGVDKLISPGPFMVRMGKLPQTPRAKQAIEYAMEASFTMKHNYVGTEHILLGLLREQDGVAAQVLTTLGLTHESVRDEILKLLAAGIRGRDESGSGDSSAVTTYQIVVTMPDSCRDAQLAAWNRLVSAVTILQHEGAIKPTTADELRRQLSILKPTN